MPPKRKTADDTSPVKKRKPSTAKPAKEDKIPAKPKAAKKTAKEVIEYEPSKINYNENITDILRELEKGARSSGSVHGANAYVKAIKSISTYPKKIENGAEARKLPGVGEKTVQKIDEILQTGSLDRFQKEREDRRLHTIEELTKVMGVGPTAAQNFYASGIRSLKDLEKLDSLTHTQRLGVKYFDDMQIRIPRQETAEIEKLIQEKLSKIDAKFQVLICGSYRRGETDSSDIDIILLHPNFTSTSPNGGKFLAKAVKHLEVSGFLIDHSAHGDIKYMGICKLPKKVNVHRRIDITMVPYDEKIPALFHCTCGQEFNRDIRAKAHDKGFLLNEHGLYRKGFTEKCGPPLKLAKEDDIFEYLGLSHVPTEEWHSTELLNGLGSLKKCHQTRNLASAHSQFEKMPVGITNPTKYGGKYTVTLIPGDGIGPELANSVVKVFQAIDAPIIWEKMKLSGERGLEEIEAEYKATVDSLRRNQVGLKGMRVVYANDNKTTTSVNVRLRNDLGLFASVAICKSLPGFQTRHQNVDFVVIRENIEGEYSGLEHEALPGVVESFKVISKPVSRQIAKFAFDYAAANNRKKVTVIHKANIMKLGDGLFLRTAKEVSELYKDIKFEQMIVDNASMQLVSRPQQFDVTLMPNLYGNIISNIGTGLLGSPALTPGVNIGKDIALFEPGARHVAKDIENKNISNPTGMLLSSAMLLRHLNLFTHANLITDAVYSVIANKKYLTSDLGGTASTTDFTTAVIKEIKQ